MRTAAVLLFVELGFDEVLGTILGRTQSNTDGGEDGLFQPYEVIVAYPGGQCFSQILLDEVCVRQCFNPSNAFFVGGRKSENFNCLRFSVVIRI